MNKQKEKIPTSLQIKRVNLSQMFGGAETRTNPRRTKHIRCFRCYGNSRGDQLTHFLPDTVSDLWGVY